MGIKCPQCNSELVLRAGRWHCPRCDFWKESYGSKSWQKHARNVAVLREDLMLRFLQVTWVPGLGALTDERLDLPPEYKGEPDLKGWWMRKHFISIEVSGTDSVKVSVPPDDIYKGYIYDLPSQISIALTSESYRLLDHIVNEYDWTESIGLP